MLLFLSIANGSCSLVLFQSVPVYPDIVEWSCRFAGGIWINLVNQQPDWIFNADTANYPPHGVFYSDSTYVPPGQQTGVCENTADPLACVASYPYSEDFEGGTGAWSDVSGDDFDWSVGSGSTPTASTGPSADHTSGSGDYLFTESTGVGPSDVDQMADALLLPYWFWGIVCGAISVAVLMMGMRSFLRATPSG